MDVTNQLFKIDVVLADDGLVTVLKKMAMALVSAININRIPCQKPSSLKSKGLYHQTGTENGRVRQKCPSVA